MTRVASLTLFLLVLARHSRQKSSPSSDSYVAAVVEFSPTNPTSSEKSPSPTNAARYVAFIQDAAKQNADVIVFPEAGLTTVELPGQKYLESWCDVVPAPSKRYNPCIHSTIVVSETLKSISCAARDNMIYAVINLSEKVVCRDDGCPADERRYYNTNVAFDREGTIIARYRKTNLFVEPNFNVTATPEVVTFQTDFGVTFGTFTCFDILFRKPAVSLTRMWNVTDVVFPTAWFSELPFLTALQIQAGWSYAEDVNLLVAGYNRPESGNAGSGIYLGREGIAAAAIPYTTTTRMLIARVPKKNASSTHPRSRSRYEYKFEAEEPSLHDELRRKRRGNWEPEGSGRGISLLREDLSAYRSERLNGSVSRDLCHANFCCRFEVRTSGIERPNERASHYRMFAYWGNRRFIEPVSVGLAVCALLLCSNETTSSCGTLEKSELVFDLLRISASFEDYENVLVIPSSLGPDLFPLADWSYEEERREEGSIRVLASLAAPTSGIVTCGLYARIFSKDSWPSVDESKIGKQWATLTALAIVSLFLLFLYRKGWRKPWQRNTGLSSEAGPYQHLQQSR